MGFPNVKTKPSTGNVIERSTITAFSSLVATGQQLVMPANESRTYLVFQNTSDTLMRINFGAAATDANGIQVQPGGSVTFNSAWVPSQSVFVRCSSNAKTFVAKEGI
jgi:hypothetical protein